MQEHPVIELYVSVGTDQQNTALEQELASVDLDAVALHTLEAAKITQPVMLTLLITDDDGIRDMNKQYREQDKPTDVLSFPLLEQPLVDAPAELLWSPHVDESSAPTGEELPAFITPPDLITNLGDIVMSWPTVVLQATQAGHEPLTELLYLLSHGVLHLVGYDDQTEAGYQAMVTIQQAVLENMGVKLRGK